MVMHSPAPIFRSRTCTTVGRQSALARTSGASANLSCQLTHTLRAPSWGSPSVALHVLLRLHLKVEMNSHYWHVWLAIWGVKPGLKRSNRREPEVTSKPSEAEKIRTLRPQWLQSPTRS